MQQQSSQVKSTSLRVLALAAKQRQDEDNAARRAADSYVETRASFRYVVQFLESVGVNTQEAITHNSTVILDEVEFGTTAVEGRRDMFIWGNCPHCGKRTRSMNIYSLAAIGEFLDKFMPEYAHECYAHSPSTSCEPSLGEQLETLIRRIVNAGNIE